MRAATKHQALRQHVKAVSRCKITKDDALRQQRLVSSRGRGPATASTNRKTCAFWVTFSPPGVSVPATSCVISPYCGLVLNVLHDGRVVVGDVKALAVAQRRLAISGKQTLHEGDELVSVSLPSQTLPVPVQRLLLDVASISPNMGSEEHSARLVGALASLGCAPALCFQHPDGRMPDSSDIRYIVDVDAVLRRRKQLEESLARSTRVSSFAPQLRRIGDCPVAGGAAAAGAAAATATAVSAGGHSAETVKLWQELEDARMARQSMDQSPEQRASDWQRVHVTAAEVKGRCFGSKYPGHLSTGCGKLMLEPHAHTHDLNAIQVLDCSNATRDVYALLPCAGYVDRVTAAFVSADIQAGADVDVEYVGFLTDERRGRIDMLRLMCKLPPVQLSRRGGHARRGLKRTHAALEHASAQPSPDISALVSASTVVCAEYVEGTGGGPEDVVEDGPPEYVRIALEQVSTDDLVMGLWNDTDGWFPGRVESIDRRKRHPYRVVYDADGQFQWLSDDMIGGRPEAIPGVPS